jgi:ABC-type branched-subunit amino acid transport system substrate-binding protein
LTDAVNYFNANGGLCGAAIAMEYEDTGGNADRVQEFWTQFTSQEDLPEMIFLYNSADAEILRDQAAELQIPILLAAGSDAALYNQANEPGWVYAIIPLYTDQFGAFCDYISDPDTWASFGIEGEPKIGHLSWGIPFGRATDTPETRAYCASKGVEVVGAEYFLPIGSPDLAGPYKNLRDAGANIIFTTTLATGTDRVVKAIAGAGDLENVIIAGTNWVLDSSVYGLGGEATNGVVGVLPYVWWDDAEHPGVAIVLNEWFKRLDAAQSEEETTNVLRLRNIAYLLSFPVVDLWIEIMTQAINNVGFESLNGAAVAEVLNNDFEYTAMEGMLDIKFDQTTRAQLTARIGQIQVSEFEGSIIYSILPINKGENEGDPAPLLDLPDLKVGGVDVPAE